MTSRKEGIPLSLHGEPDLGNTFWDHLTDYFGAVVAHTVDQRGLHTQGLRFKTLQAPNMSLPSQLAVPSVVFKLSDVLPNAVPSSPAKNLEQSKDGSGETVVGEARASPTGSPSEKALSQNRAPWAHDQIEIKYRNVVFSDDDPNRRRLAYSADAIITVVDKRKLSMLKSKVGRDVLYNPIKGQFCIRLQANIGDTMVDKLKGRLTSIDRVVACIDAMNHSHANLKCESVTLQRVVFTYEDRLHNILQQMLQPVKNADGAAAGAGGGAQSATPSPPKRYQATLNLSGPQIKIEFEPGNPHARILDLLTALVNRPNGIRTLTAVLPETIHPLSCLDRIATMWREIARKNIGVPVVTHRAVDWFSIVYELPENATRPRSIAIDVRLRSRDGKLYWYATRTDSTAPSSASAGQQQPAAGGNQQQQQQQQQPPQDVFADKLKRVFQTKSTQWRPLGNAVAMPAESPLVGLMAVDRCIREATVAMETPTPQGQQAQQQQQQQQGSNHNTTTQQQPGAVQQPNRTPQMGGQRGIPPAQQARGMAPQQGGKGGAQAFRK
jgi:mediator of RNA polymerase II transcription subunit 14